MRYSLVALSSIAAISAVLFAAEGDIPPPPTGATTPTAVKSEYINANKSISVSLKKGWNMVSIPGYSQHSSSSIFGDSSKIYNVFGYDAATGGYKQYKPSAGIDTIGNIEPNKGYWVYAIADAEYVFTVSVPVATTSTTTSSSSSTTTSGTTSAPPPPPAL